MPLPSSTICLARALTLIIHSTPKQEKHQKNRASCTKNLLPSVLQIFCCITSVRYNLPGRRGSHIEMSRARRVDANPSVEPPPVLLAPGQQLQVPVAGREPAGIRVPRAPVSPRPPKGVKLTLVDGRGARGLVPLTVLRERLETGNKNKTTYRRIGGMQLGTDYRGCVNFKTGETRITGNFVGR